jgi:Borrelia P83/100 protein
LKYSIIRAISAEEPQKFSADIFSIDKDAKVGHIDAVRAITTSYLKNRYGYSRKDAGTLSLFISYYNAVYRGNTGYFSSKYKRVVMKYISGRNAGISTKYWEWPGATRMLIPLTEEPQKGKLDSVSPDVISDKKIIEQLRREDKNIPQRKDMADLKERILEKDKKRLEEEKAAIEKEKKAVVEEKQPVEKKKEELRKEETALKKEKEEAKKIAEPERRKEREKEIAAQEKKIEEEKKETKKKEDEISKKEEEAKKKEKEIADQEKKIAAREESLKEEKKQIERDEIKRDIAKEPEQARIKLEEKEKELDRREDKLRAKELDKSIYADKLYYLKIKEYLEGGHYNNEMYMINASTRKILFKSPVENICGSRYDVFSGGVVVITHRGSHTSGHRLTLVDRDTLQAKIYGNDDVFWRSFIEIREGFIYAITYDSGRHYLARFDSGLKLVAKSKEEINENTFISFWGNYIYINRLDKAIIVLNKDDLSLLDEVKP